MERKKYSRKNPRIDQLIPHQIKPKWNHLPTKAIRVPESLSAYLLEIARQLDKNEDFFLDENRFPRQTIEFLLPNLSLAQLEKVEKLFSSLKSQKQREEELEEASHRIRLLSPSEKISLDDDIAVYAPYDPTSKFQNAAKRIDNYRYEPQDQSWRYPLSSIVKLLEAFPEPQYKWQSGLSEVRDKHLQQKIEEELKIQQEREAAAKAGAEKIDRLINAAEVDKPLLNGWFLRDYQKEAVLWLLSHIKGGLYRGGILADDMGLGKSIEALAAARAMQEVDNCHVFIICPVSLIENWQREAEKVGVRVEIFSNHYRKIPQPVSSPYIAIADEAHAFQNPKSARTKKINQLIENEHCLAAWLLSGTPIKNGQPINLFPLLQMCQHKLALDKWHYFDRYCNAQRRTVGKKTIWDLTGAAHLDELSKETKDVILRRTKKECLTELPVKTRLYKAIKLETKEQKAYKKQLKKLIAGYRARVKAGEVDEGAEALVTINYLRKTGSEFKIAPAIALTEELLEQGQQVILFTEFVDTAKALYKAINQIIDTQLLIGETKDRQQAVDRFQSGESKVFVGTIKAGGVGLTLTAASNVILVDRPWTPGDTEQAEDRAYRIGQQNAVFVYWLQLGNIDRAIDSLIVEKNKRISLVLKGKQKILDNIDSPKELAQKLLLMM